MPIIRVEFDVFGVKWKTALQLVWVTSYYSSRYVQGGIESHKIQRRNDSYDIYTTIYR